VFDPNTALGSAGFEGERLPGTALASRDSLAKTPYFLKTNSCLALIPGKTG